MTEWTEPPPDICRNNHGGQENSEAANLSTMSRKEKDRARIYAWIAARGWYGAICDEVVAALDMLPQTAYPRRSEMLRDGDLVVTGRKRKTARGKCLADVVVTREVWADHEWKQRHPLHFPNRSDEQTVML